MIEKLPASPSSVMRAALFFHEWTPTGHAICYRNIEAEKRNAFQFSLA